MLFFGIADTLIDLELFYSMLFHRFDAMPTPTETLWELPVKLQSLIQAELNEKERISWVGTPDPKRFGMRAWPMVLFGIPWTAFALFWIAGACGFKIPDFNKGFDFFPLFGIPFVLIGLGLLTSPVWMMKKARNTAYVLTTDRAIIFEKKLATAIRSFEPEQLRNLRRTQWDDGAGDLIFERQIAVDNNQQRQQTDIGFLAIPDVKEVEAMVRELAESSL